ncbi:MAG: hypothetical protein RLZZ292_3419 [Bacteroidota bacterium]|jgi:hypothetical protein
MQTNTVLESAFRYAKEVFIIFLGVSISFLVDKCKNDYQDKMAEATLLVSLRLDLVKDSTQLHEMCVGTRLIVHGVKTLYDNIDDFAPIEDSLYEYIRTLSFSSVFTPTNMTYEEIKQNGFSKLLKNQKLRRNIYELYCNNYEDLKVVSTKVGTRIELDVSPVLHQRLPFTKTGIYTPPQIKEVKALFKENHLKNIVRFSLRDQQMSLRYYEGTYEKVKVILKEIPLH